MPPRRKRNAKSSKITVQDREPAPKRRRRVRELSPEEDGSTDHSGTSSTPGAETNLQDHASEQVGRKTFSYI